MKTTGLVMFSILMLLSCGGSTGNGVNVLLVLLDTVRADHLHCYGYELATSPVIDSLVSSGTIFTQLQSQSSWTLPSMASILTGVSPREHGAGRRNSEFYGISPELPSMPLHFHTSGYETAAFINVIFMSEDFGFHRGFDHFDCQGFANRHSLRRAGETVDLVLDWLDQRNPERPFFIALHFYDPHIPYNPPEPWASMFTDPGYVGEYDTSWGSVPQMNAINTGEVDVPERGLLNIIGLYDGEIAYTDHELGRLLAELRRRGIAENTIVVVVADHGEEFLEHGRIEHGVDLFQEVLHVPLVFSGPGIERGVWRETPVSQMDIFPTLSDLAGLEPPGGISGKNMLGSSGISRDIPSSGVLWASSDMASVRQDNLKVIWCIETDSIAAYDLLEDPGELSPFPPDSVLTEALQYYWATPAMAEPPLVPFGETMSRELRDLGYVR